MNKDTDHSHNKHTAGENIKSAISDSGDHLKQFSSQLIEELSEFLKSKKSDISGMKGKCKSSIKENPFVAVLGALVIGALIGMICKK